MLNGGINMICIPIHNNLDDTLKGYFDSVSWTIETCYWISMNELIKVTYYDSSDEFVRSSLIKVNSDNVIINWEVI